jgi:serine kinase of HPr protein (carbohydrate metabolism regulator)
VEGDVRIEVRGLGVFRARSLFHDGTLPASRIDFAVELDAYDASRDAGRVVPEKETIEVLDQDLLAVRVPVPNGIDPGLLVELLAKLFATLDRWNRDSTENRNCNGAFRIGQINGCAHSRRYGLLLC